MTNLETGGNSPELFDTTGFELLSQDKFETTFNDDFFKNLNSDDPRKKIEKREIDGKVYFEKPNPNGDIVRYLGTNNVFVDKFYISKEDWNNILNRRNGISGAVQTAQAETQQLSQEVAATATPQESPETLGASVEARTDALLDWFEDFSKKRPISKRPGESHDTKERLKEVIRNDIAYLKSVKRELKRYTYTFNPEIFQENLDALESHKQPLIEARQIIAGGGNTSELPTILASLRDIKRADKFENKMAKYNKKVNELLKDATLKRLWNEDMEGFQDYLEDVWSGAIEHPAQHPFYTQHMRDFQHIQSINPTLYSQITTCQNPKRKQQAQGEVYTGPQVVVCQGQPQKQCDGRGVLDKGAEIWGDTLVTLGLIDENDTKKIEAHNKLAKGALYCILAYAGYKIITEKGGKRWAWAGGTAAALLGMANKDGIAKIMKDAFGKSNPTPNEVLQTMNESAHVNRPTSTETQEIIDTFITPTCTTIQAIGGININTLIEEGIISTDNDKFTFDYDKHSKYVKDHVTDPDEKLINIQAGQKLKEDPSLVDKGLVTLGITNIDALKVLGEKNNRLIDCDKLGTYLNNLSSPINADLSKQGFKPKDCESRYKIMNDRHGKTSMTNKDFKRYVENGRIILKDDSLNEYIDNNLIDRENKCMVGCENIKFTTYGELLKAVKITSRIINEFKGKNARDDHPFHLGVGGVGGNIQFNDGILGDTDILKANIIHNTLEEISPTLNNNKRAYVDYLNILWNA